MSYDQAAEARHRALRDEFLLRPEVVFLNHGSFGACPRPVFERYQALQVELEGQPVEFLGRRVRDMMAAARAALAAYMGAEADDVVYFPNVTHALNVVARSIRLEPGDEVLACNHEYGALDRTWRFLSERQGARYVVHPLADPLPSPEEAVEQLWTGVTDRTRVLFLSHITSPTAVVLPIGPLIARARARGILTVVDGAHAPSQLDLDLPALGVDFYGGNCHKWLCSPKGSGFLYARREVQPMVEPLIVSWGWQPRDPGPSPFVDAQERQGSRDPAPFLATPDAIRFQAERDWATVRAECSALVSIAQAQVGELYGLPQYADERWRAPQMASLPLPPGVDAAELKRRLYDEHRVEIPVTSWNGRTFVRISVQGYTTRADVDALVAALRQVVPVPAGVR